MYLRDLCAIGTNMTDADFYLRRTGTEATVGTPTRNASPDDIGIRVTRTDVLVPDYLYYLLQYMHMQGAFKLLATGTATKVLTAKSVGDIPVQQQ